MVDLGTAQANPEWHPSPPQRGTGALISECVITLLLCVWTAVHLNLPEKEPEHDIESPSSSSSVTRWLQKQKQKWQWRRTWWCVFLTGVLAPEILVFMAWGQSREARALHREVERALLGSRREGDRGEEGGEAEGRREKKDGEKGWAVVLGHVKGWVRRVFVRTGESDSLRIVDAERDAAGSCASGDTGGRGGVVDGQGEGDGEGVRTTTRTTTKPARRHQWTMTHSFFASMGGFAFDSEALVLEQRGRGRGQEPKSKPKHKLPGGHRRMAVLSSIAIIRLANTAPHLLPDIPAAQIKDKSKSNTLANAVVVLQAAWFLMQCVSRLAIGGGGDITISLLELTTLVHCLGALVAYLLWWNKPLDVEEPILIQGEDADLLCAGMSMKSSMGTRRLAEDLFTGQRMVARLWYDDDSGEMDSRSPGPGLIEHLTHGIRSPPTTRVSYLDTVRENAAPREQPPPQPEPQSRNLYMGQSLHGFSFRRSPCYTLPDSPQRNSNTSTSTTQPRSPTKVSNTVANFGILSLQRPFITLNQHEIQWLRLAQQCYRKYPNLTTTTTTTTTTTNNNNNSYREHPSSPHKAFKLQKEYLLPRILNWNGVRIPLHNTSTTTPNKNNNKTANLQPPTPIKSSILIAFLTTALYGGIHLLAWNPPISSPAEAALWRVTGIVVACWFPVIILFLLLLFLSTAKIPSFLGLGLGLGLLGDDDNDDHNHNNHNHSHNHNHNGNNNNDNDKDDNNNVNNNDNNENLQGRGTKHSSFLPRRLNAEAIRGIFATTVTPRKGDHNNKNKKNKKTNVGAVLVFVANVIVWLVATVLVLLGLFARLYLPIESVVSVPRLPDTAFETPVWARYFPHVS